MKAGDAAWMILLLSQLLYLFKANTFLWFDNRQTVVLLTFDLVCFSYLFPRGSSSWTILVADCAGILFCRFKRDNRQLSDLYSCENQDDLFCHGWKNKYERQQIHLLLPLGRTVWSLYIFSEIYRTEVYCVFQQMSVCGKERKLLDEKYSVVIALFI